MYLIQTESGKFGKVIYTRFRVKIQISSDGQRLIFLQSKMFRQRKSSLLPALSESAIGQYFAFTHKKSDRAIDNPVITVAMQSRVLL